MTAEAHGPADLDARGLVTELFAALNDHDVERIVGMHASDAVWEDPSLAAPITGRAAIAEHLRVIHRAFPDLRFDGDVELYTGEQGRAGARWRFGATMTGPLDPPGFAPTGKRTTVAGVCLYTFEDGLIARHRQYYDMWGMLEQLGLMPALESVPARLVVGLQRAGARVSKSLHRAS